MAITTFTDLHAAVRTQGQQGNFDRAYALLSAEGDRFPADAATVWYLRACMAERMGQRAEALTTLRSALEQGHWYSDHLLRAGSAWQSLRDDPAFAQLVSQSQAAMQMNPPEPTLLLHLPEGTAPPAGWPLLLALHDDGSNAHLALEGWQPAAADWLLAAPQSSQALSSAQYNWADVAQVQTDITTHLATLRTAHPIDSRQTVLAGRSGGAEAALHLALSGAVATQGVVLLAPSGPLSSNPERWLPLISGAADRRLRAAVVIGDDDDTDLVDNALQLAPLLDDHGIPCYLEVVPELGHTYPHDGGAALRRGLNFVNGT